MKRMKDLDLAGKRVLIRQDLNVPVKDGRVTSDVRIRASLPTIEHARDAGARVMLMSHLGRPTEGEFDEQFSLRPVAEHLSELLGSEVALVTDANADGVADGQVVLLENVRFHSGETKNNEHLSRELASFTDYYVNDAFGVLPPISRLNKGQAMFHFISGYTAKVAGTEAGITEPVTAFSACFGAPFLPLHPTKYAEMLGDKMTESNVNVWLINTGWTGGPYGVGERMSLKHTRAMITAALNGDLENVEYNTHEVFGLEMPTTCPNVPENVLNPKNTWEDKSAYDAKAYHLAEQFVNNFEQFAENANEEIMAAAPKIKQTV